MRTKVYALCLCVLGVLAAACTGTQPESAGNLRQGVAEFRIESGVGELAATITRVTVEAATGETEDLTANNDGTFSGLLFLPAGPQSVVARAFSSSGLVGESHPVAVEIQPNVVTRIRLRILDLTGGGATFGPILDSLTFPTVAQTSVAVTLALSVIAPGGDPVSYAWTSDCADSTFDPPDAATTSWSRPTQGACVISVVATSHGLSLSQTFSIVVFPAEVTNGAVDATGELIAAPVLGLSFPGFDCDVLHGGANSSCPRTVSSPEIRTYTLSTFDWGRSTPGTLELSDNCGGRFGFTTRDQNFLEGAWLPPAGGGLCLLTGRAVSGIGAVGTVTAAILTRPGAPATSGTPQLSVLLSDSFSSCSFGNNDPSMPRTCSAKSRGAFVSVRSAPRYPDGHAGSIDVTDDCGGGHTEVSAGFFDRGWTVTGVAGTLCTVTVHATSLEGVEASATVVFTIL